MNTNSGDFTRYQRTKKKFRCLLARAQTLIRRDIPKFDLAALALDDSETILEMVVSPTHPLMRPNWQPQGIGLFLRSVLPHSVHDIAAAIALYRPGPMASGLADTYVARAMTNCEPSMVEAYLRLEPSVRFCLIYQEQIIETAMSLANFSAREAEDLRRALTNSLNRNKLPALQDRFIQRVAKEVHDPNIAPEIYAYVAKNGCYSFSRAFAYETARIVYHFTYLKTHFRKYLRVAGGVR